MNCIFRKKKRHLTWVKIDHKGAFSVFVQVFIMFMWLSIVTLAPTTQEYRSGDLPGDSILYFVTSKVQPQVLYGTAGDIFLVNPWVGPHPINPDTFGVTTNILPGSKKCISRPSCHECKFI